VPLAIKGKVASDKNTENVKIRKLAKELNKNALRNRAYELNSQIEVVLSNSFKSYYFEVVLSLTRLLIIVWLVKSTINGVCNKLCA